jgi:hypothetical protein
VWDVLPKLGTTEYPVRAIAGNGVFWVGAWAGGVVRQIENESDVEEITKRDADELRDVHDVAAMSANEIFVVGSTLSRDTATGRTAVSESPVEACDSEGCSLEAIYPQQSDVTFRAVTGTTREAMFAVSQDTVYRRSNSR